MSDKEAKAQRTESAKEPAATQHSIPDAIEVMSRQVDRIYEVREQSLQVYLKQRASR